MTAAGTPESLLLATQLQLCEAKLHSNHRQCCTCSTSWCITRHTMLHINHAPAWW